MGHGTRRVTKSRIQVVAVLVYWAATCLADGPNLESRSASVYDKDTHQGKHGSYPVKRFESSSIKAPRTNFVLNSPECTSDPDEFYFLTPKGWKVDSPGPMILDSSGELVWTEHSSNEFGGQAYDLMVQEYQNEKYLTFWLGDDRIKGHGAGHFYMLNSSYDIVHKVGAANGKFADLHEFLITAEGTALLIVFEIIPFDVRPAGRKFNDLWNQRLWDCLIQEIDIATGEAVFEWRASEHLDLRSYKKLLNLNDGTSDHPYDPWHFNSVTKDELGNYLVSARYTHAVYYISGKTKEVIWQLGGQGNDFMDLSEGEALNFAWQHDARFHPTTSFPGIYTPPQEQEGVTTRLLTLFDNSAEDWNYAYGHKRARGLILEISYPTHGTNALRAESMTTEPAHSLSEGLSSHDKTKIREINGTDPRWTVRSIHQYLSPAEVPSSSQGSLQVLPPRKVGEDSRVVLGHGINAIVTEFGGSTLLCEMHFGAKTSWEKGDVQSYRAFKHSGWIGRPKQPPAALRKVSDVFVSWNGATEVRQWKLQGSGDGVEWVDMVTVEKMGFETKLPIAADSDQRRSLRVVAIDRNGEICENGLGSLGGGRFGGGSFASPFSWQSLVILSVMFVGIYYGLGFLRQRISESRRKKDERYKLP